MLRKINEPSNYSTPQTQQFSTLIQDYLANKDTVKPLFNKFPTVENIWNQAEQKIKNYSHRKVLTEALEKQLSTLTLSKKQVENLQKLKQENTVTVTTGHQLNLFTGPIYFFYKILQTIKLAETLNKQQKNIAVVPVFWMATEDHDFEEINHFNYNNKKITWNRPSSGAVGKLSLENLSELAVQFFSNLPASNNNKKLQQLFTNAYLKHDNLTNATRFLVHELFSEFGLLMIDGDDKSLKQLITPAFKEELQHQIAIKKVAETNAYLEDKKYTVQVNPREINLFYMPNDSTRERIIWEDGSYIIANTNLKFSQEEILQELNVSPQKFSPNVILRPLYQETILPNVAYIGGSGEIAYWLQLQSFFESQQVNFPILIVRNSMLIASEKQAKKMRKLNLSVEDLLQPMHKIIQENVRQNSHVTIDFKAYEHQLEQMFKDLLIKAKSTDVTFENMIKAQQTKQLKGLDKVKKRLIKAERLKQANRVKRITALHTALFPNQKLQERSVNFSQLYSLYGSQLIYELYASIEPIDFHFHFKSFT